MIILFQPLRPVFPMPKAPSTHRATEAQVLLHLPPMLLQQISGFHVCSSAVHISVVKESHVVPNSVSFVLYLLELAIHFNLPFQF